MKIIIWVYRLGGGGAERVMTDLASSFAEAGHDVQVCVHGPNNPYAADLSAKSHLRVMTSSPLIQKLRLRTPLSFTRLLLFIRRYKPDVVFTTGAGHGLQLPLLRRLSCMNFTTVLRETNTLTSQRKKSKSLLTRLIVSLTRYLYPLNDYTVATSQGVENDLLKFIPDLKGRLVQIANPIHSEKLRSLAAKAPNGDISDKDYILAVGRLVPQKGFDLLIRAWSANFKKYPYKLIILGEGPERETLRSLATFLDIQDHLIMPGFQENPFSYMGHAKLFVLSSYYEGLPNVLLQALACGCRVVSTDCPSGPREILDGGRLAPLVPVGDVDALAKGMVEAMENTQSYPLSPWSIIEGNYNPDHIRDSYLSLFSKQGHHT